MKLPKRVKLPAVIAAGVVLAGGGTAYAVVGGEDAPSYRTVRAVQDDVDQTLSFTGLVDAAQRSDLSFGTGGTVAKVKVAEGDAVKAGQVIATLATDDLDAAVTDAVATLAKAKAQLESDQDAQTSSVQQDSNPSSPGNAGNGGSGPSQSSTGGSNASAAVLKKLKEQQQAVLDAQSAASAALSAAHDALAAQTAACADAYQPPSTPSSDPTATATPSTTADDSDANAACETALADVQAKQDAVKDAQDRLATALNQLTTTLSSALGSVGSTSSTGHAPAAARTAASSTSSQVPSSSSGGTVTAARLASDQAQIDQAKADLISAKAARSQAVLRSTRTGTLVELDLKKGDAVSTGTSVAVVVGGKAVTLTGTIPEASVETVKPGQAVRVTVPGSSTTTTGTVTAVGMTADSSSGSTTYPVTVTVEDPTIALPSGSRAQAAIVLSTVKDVVTVPISAVTRTGEIAVVEVWNGKTLTRTRVTLGAVGARSVQVDGVKAGTEVVVADIDQAIKGASDELNQRGSFGGPGGGTFTFRRSGAGGGGGPVTFSR